LPTTYTLTRVDWASHDADFDYPLWHAISGLNNQGHVTSTWEFNDDCGILDTGVFDSRLLAMIGGAQVNDGDATTADAINRSGQVTGYSALTSSTYYNESCGEYRTMASGPYHAFR